MPISPIMPRSINETSIFVGLAAFREPRCGRTLYDGFTKATNPARVRFGVVDQLDDNEDEFTCLTDYCQLMEAALLEGKHKHLQSFVDVAKQQAHQCVFAPQVQTTTKSEYILKTTVCELLICR